MKAFADIHCHPTLHPFAFYHEGKKSKNSLWSDNRPKNRQRNNTYPEYFQMSMPALARGNVRLVIASLYPLEQPWFKPNLIGTGNAGDFIASNFMVHIPPSFINKVQSKNFNYFDYLNKEYAFLLKEHSDSHTISGVNWKYKVAKNKSEISAFLNEANTIVIIPSIEGAHSLVSGNAEDIYLGDTTKNKHIENILIMKNTWASPPLFVTLGHHFYNGICGHARSIPDGLGSFLIRQGIGLGDPINSYGEEVIDCLLGINNHEGNGRRILIDTKHMSLAARLQYHQKIAKYNEGKPKELKIPIVASHTAFNGFNKMQDSILSPDTMNKKYKNSSTYNTWSINLSRQELVEIFRSNGLIGLNLDQRVLSGNQVIKRIKKLTRRRDIRKVTPLVKKLWGQQITNNIMELVKSVVFNESIPTSEKPRVWDIISIGSDFDGMINPIDSCIVADEFKNLRSTLSTLMPEHPDFTRCIFHYTVDAILDKIMYNNAVNFVIRNYS